MESRLKHTHVHQAAGGVLNLWPAVRYVAPDLTGYTTIKKASDGAIKLIKVVWRILNLRIG